jgi:exodeoxyribonuclease VII small subunit
MAKFEEQLTALEAVVERLERGELSLDESVDLFEEGVRLSNACKKDLDSAEGRIQALTEEGDGEVRDLELTMPDEDEFEQGEDEE